MNVTELSVLVDARFPRLEVVPVAALAFTLAMTVPEPVIPPTAALYLLEPPVIVTVLVPNVALPPLVLMPAEVNPLTASLNTTVKLMGDALVGSACPAAWLMVTVG